MQTPLYVADADGRNLKRLTPIHQPYGSPSYPSWSPDGRLIAFVASKTSYPGNITVSALYTIRPDGTHLKRLTRQDMGWDTPPRWSPNGDKVALACLYGKPAYEERKRICVVRKDGSGFARLSGLVGAVVTAVLMFTTAATASSASTGMATGWLTYEGWAGTESIALVAEGSPAAASGWMQFKRESPVFYANSGGPVTLLPPSRENRAYFAGRFARTFFSGPTEVLFFNGVVVDGDQTGERDRAFAMLGADAPIPCDDAGTMSFLDSVSFAATGGNVVVH